MKRRSFLGLATAMGALTATGVWAKAPMVGGQAPGFYRMKLGAYEVTVLNDGSFPMPVDQYLKGIPPEEITSRMKAAGGDVPQVTSVNCFLINTGEKLVLVDSGAGGSFGPLANRLVANLKAAGYQPEQIDAVLITHMHGDHVAGLSNGGVPTFANADVYVDDAELAFWVAQDQAALKKAKAGEAPAQMAASLKPYIDAKRVKTFTGTTPLFSNGTTPVVSGITAVETKGHTPGHSVYKVESEGQRLWLIGDIIHVGAIQFPDPKVTIGFDNDSAGAVAARMKLFKDLSMSGDLVGATHLSFPGIGRVTAAGEGFGWAPLSYNANP